MANFLSQAQRYDGQELEAVIVDMEEELQDEGYGEIYSRLKAKDMLKQAGIKGKKVGFSSTGKPSTAPINLEIDKREIKYFDPSPVSIDLTSSNRYVKTILKQFSKWKKKP